MYTLTDNDFIVLERELSVPAGKRYVLKIKDMPSEDKPREKLRKYGPAVLSTQELLAILLGQGTKKEDILTMANRLVKEYGEQALMSQTDAEKLSDDLGLPLTKALQLVASAELGRRFFQKKTKGGPALLRTAKDVSDYARDLQELPKEHLRGIYLNTHYRVIHDEIISIGTINSNIIHPREVFKPAIEYGAAAVILVHNHPSGVTKPSQADIEITEQLVAVGKIIGINLIDHVIVANGRFVSVDVAYS